MISDECEMTGSTKSSRADGRKPMLVYLPPRLIQALKTEALGRDEHLYIMLEKMLCERSEFSHLGSPTKP